MARTLTDRPHGGDAEEDVGAQVEHVAERRVRNQCEADTACGGQQDRRGKQPPSSRISLARPPAQIGGRQVGEVEQDEATDLTVRIGVRPGQEGDEGGHGPDENGHGNPATHPEPSRLRDGGWSNGPGVPRHPYSTNSTGFVACTSPRTATIRMGLTVRSAPDERDCRRGPCHVQVRMHVHVFGTRPLAAGGQGLRPIPPDSSTAAGTPKSPGSGCHRWMGTTPGSTSSSPSK